MKRPCALWATCGKTLDLGLFCISRATMYLAIKDGRLPPPIKLSSRFIAWESRVIKALVSDLEAQAV